MTRGPCGAAPAPPPDLAERELPLDILPAGAALARIHRRDRGPIFFSPGPGNPPAGRFDSATGAFGVLYAALSFNGAFVEAVLRNPARRIVGQGELASRAFAVLAVTREAALVDLTGSGLQSLGLDASIFTGPYEPCGAWADAFHSHPSRPSGILYPSRHDPSEHCVALFGPDGAEVEIAGDGVPLTDLAEDVAAALRRYGKALDPG